MATKLLFTILLAFSMIGFVSATCTDSDGGINIYENGEVHFRSQYAQDYDTGVTTYDSCSDEKLYEYYCSADGNSVEQKELSCPENYQCYIDKCIKNDEEYVPDIEGSGEAPSSGGGGGSSRTDSCTKYYSCPDGTQVKYCSRVREETPITCVNSTTPGAGPLCRAGSVTYECKCNENPQSLCSVPVVPATVFFKSCSYIWDSSSYVGQTINISASIKDSTGKSDSDSVSVAVVDTNMGGGGSGGSMDGRILDIQINQPTGTQVRAGAVEIKISSKGPNELGNMTLGFSGDGWGAGFPISNRNCIAGGSSSGGGSGGTNVSACERYHVCQDGSQVQYCSIVKQYNDNGEVVGAGCGCKSNPESLCTASSGSGGGGSGGHPIIINSSTGGSSGGGGSAGTNQTPIMCSGCILGDRCAPVGYINEEKYCKLNGEFVSQLSADASCENNFECSTNLCIDKKCVSSGVWQKFVRWLSRLFG